MKKRRSFLIGLTISGLLLTGCNFNNGNDGPAVVTKEFTGLSFEDKTVAFDGTAKTIELAGTLPEGAKVSYGTSGNSFTTVGAHKVTVTVTCDGYTTWTKEATLTITKATFTNIVFESKTVNYNGEKQTITPSNLPTGTTITYEGEHEFILPGTYTITAKLSKEGYEDKTIEATLKINPVEVAEEALNIDDFEDIGDSDLASDWKLEYYDNGWITPSKASINVAKNQVLGTGSQTMKLSLSHQGQAFKVTKNVTKGTKPAVYKGIALDALSDVTHDSATKLQVQLWLKDLPLPTEYAGYKDTYITYTLATDMSTNWTHYEIPFDDASISIASGAIPVSALSSLGLTLDDISLYIDKVAVLVTPGFVSGGPKAYAYLDNVKLITSTDKKTETTVDIKDKSFTALSANGTVVKATANNDNTCKIESLNLETNFAFNGTYTVTGENVNINIPTGVDKSIDFALKAKLNGAKLAVGGVTGDLASFATVQEHFGFTQMDEIITIDNFDSYTATGIGYDRGHRDPSAATGLRAAYYGEVYNESKPASGPIDPKWNLMNDAATGWSNYIKLEDTGVSGKAMSIYNNSDWQTRYMTASLAAGGAESLGRGNKLSFFVKGSVAQTMKIRVYYENQITTENQGATSGSVAILENIAVGTDWTQVTVELDAHREVYGVMITPTKKNGTIYLDNMELIGQGNPYAVAEKQEPAEETTVSSYVMDFQGDEYVVNSEIDYTNWTKQRYGSSGWETAGKMYAKKASNTTNKFINMYSGYGYTYKYEYTLPKMVKDANHVSFKYSNDFSGKDVKVKVAIILEDGSTVYLAGDASNYITIPAGTGDRNNDKMVSFDAPLGKNVNIKGIRFVLNCASGDHYTYIDDITFNHVD